MKLPQIESSERHTEAIRQMSLRETPIHTETITIVCAAHKADCEGLDVRGGRIAQQTRRTGHSRVDLREPACALRWCFRAVRLRVEKEYPISHPHHNDRQTDRQTHRQTDRRERESVREDRVLTLHENGSCEITQ